MFLSKFRLMSVLAVVLCVWLLPSSVDAQEVHALLVIMDDAERIAPSVQADRDKLRKLLKTHVDDAYKTNIKTLQSSAGETTVPDILRKIRSLRPGPDDVVLFYFSGHGGMISKTDRRTFMLVSGPANLDGAQLLRDDVEEAVKSHNCRLKLIITDCCSSSPPQPRARSYTTFAAVRGANKAIIRNLLGEHKGLLHINGATEGQYGWGLETIGESGGIFTTALIAAIAKDSDGNNDGFVEWSEVIALAKRQTIDKSNQVLAVFSDSLYPNDPQATTQIPRVYSLPERSRGKSTELTADLWDLSNAYSDTGVSLDANKGAL